MTQEDASEAPTPDQKEHPLTRFRHFDGVVRPPRWVISGFIGHGVVVIAGAPGVGKTTALLPLAMTASGLFGDEQLMPHQWRHNQHRPSETRHRLIGTAVLSGS